MPFPQDVRTKALLWSDRHCCLCKKACGVNIEVHHLVPEEKGGTDDLDNAIPLCFDCHGQVQHYNVLHPRGNRYAIKELKSRREQVYDQFTQHLVPPIHVEISQDLGGGQKWQLPRVGCNVTAFGTFLPVKARVTLVVNRGKRAFRLTRHHLSGSQLIHLNPGLTLRDNFRLPNGCWPGRGELSILVRLTVIDPYGREHDLLPVHFVFRARGKYWFLRPY